METEDAKPTSDDEWVEALQAALEDSMQLDGRGAAEEGSDAESSVAGDPAAADEAAGQLPDTVRREAAHAGQNELNSRRYFSAITGRPVRDTGDQTGTLGGRLVKKDKVTKGQTVGEATRRMKLMVPLFEGISMRPHLR